MERDLIKFYENISKVSKDVFEYEDEKGNFYFIPAGQILLSCEYKELNKKEYEQAVFQMQIDKKVELEEIKGTKLVDKSTITKDKKDQGTLIESEQMVKRAWIVKNGLGISKTFNNKEEAIKTLKEINDDLLIKAELK